MAIFLLLQSIKTKLVWISTLCNPQAGLQKVETLHKTTLNLRRKKSIKQEGKQ